MEKIINGKKYSTETGESLATYEYGNATNWEYVYEELYKTKKGTYFLYYKGGAMSKYSESVGNGGSSGSAGIELLTEEEAKEFMVSYASVDEYEQEFGEVEEG
ncbi:hypothetical protein P7H62_03705 [Vagococcus carniphilus]|uniref:hypothetical protein n=1 Tax=Vagococcus carniphilus TaxID=218144 RepID=UPI00289180B3|nr:hypothetical protein [Vagococcus carniphilus]MDT2830275.1 hypothetical protein [Vagococcus carniphilus]MDT2838707.1 hypothetical protein [Vagococcus carniphilus]MDT2853545.1 hypothetical protein [Vagococcus carniphilus]